MTVRGWSVIAVRVHCAGWLVLVLLEQVAAIKGRGQTTERYGAYRGDNKSAKRLPQVLPIAEKPSRTRPTLGPQTISRLTPVSASRAPWVAQTSSHWQRGVDPIRRSQRSRTRMVLDDAAQLVQCLRSPTLITG